MPSATKDGETVGLGAARFVIKDLQRRVQQLEGDSKKSLLKIVTTSASTSALLLGLILTLTTLYDVFVSKPAANRVARINQFNQAVNSAAKTRQELAQLQIQSADPRLQLAMAQFATPRILNDVSTATAILSGMSDDEIGIPQLIVLISEAFTTNDLVNAKILVDRAVAKKDATDFLQSEAKRYEGKYHFASGNPDMARRSYEQAVTVLGSKPATAAARAYALSDAATMELMLGNCEIAIDKLKRVAVAISTPDIMRDNQAQMKATLQDYVRQWPQEKCAIPGELLTLLSK